MPEVAQARPAPQPRSPQLALKALFGDLQSVLTLGCLVFMILGLFPGFGASSYISIACGSVFAFESMWASIKERILDVNFLMIFAAVGAIIVGQPEDAAILLFLFSLSGTLEARAMRQTRSAIEDLIQLRPSTASRRENGGSRVVRIEELQLGDIVEIAPFSAVPVDGEVIEGSGSLDQSAMTGEAAPYSVGPGSKVIGGTQNLESLLAIRVTSTVGDSTLDRIVELVRESQENKASGERISQWFGQRYTLFVIAAFGVSLLVRLALGQAQPLAFYSSLTLLVGLSPCALVISTPATTLSALAWAARNGLLVRGGEFIERAGKIKIVALDKTGTLTTGKPVLCSIDHFSDVEHWKWTSDDAPTEREVELLGLAAAVEQYSRHPLATAICQAADRQQAAGLNAADATTHPGLGVSATVDGGRVLVGNSAFLKSEGFDFPEGLKRALETTEGDGTSYALMASPSGITVFSFVDAIRPNAAEVLRELQSLGVSQVHMLTGDHERTAQVIAKQLGLTSFSANLMPDDKANKIAELSRQGEVLMVGDGVNDAPSLSLASVGVAMGGLGSDIALNAADVVIMNDRLELIPKLIRLGRKTAATIRLNLLFAGGVIVTLAVSSLLIRLPLPIAVMGHEGSTVLVILNGLRLLRGPSPNS